MCIEEFFVLYLLYIDYIEKNFMYNIIIYIVFRLYRKNFMYNIL